MRASVHIQHIFAGTCLLIFYFGLRGRAVNSKLQPTSTRHILTHARRRHPSCEGAKRLPCSITLVTKQWNACGGPCVSASRTRCLRCMCPGFGRHRASQSISATEMHQPAANARKIVKHDKALLTPGGFLGAMNRRPNGAACCALLTGNRVSETTSKSHFHSLLVNFFSVAFISGLNALGVLCFVCNIWD